jgi:hypothetical protein
MSFQQRRLAMFDPSGTAAELAFDSARRSPLVEGVY